HAMRSKAFGCPEHRSEVARVLHAVECDQKRGLPAGRCGLQQILEIAVLGRRHPRDHPLVVVGPCHCCELIPRSIPNLHAPAPPARRPAPTPPAGRPPHRARPPPPARRPPPRRKSSRTGLRPYTRPSVTEPPWRESLSIPSRCRSACPSR